MRELLLDETIGFFFGLIVGGALTKLWDIIQDTHHAGWSVLLRYEGKTIIERDVSPRKIMNIFEEPADMAVFVKGVISPYGRIGCDPLETEGLIVRDERNRQIVIDLDKDIRFVPSNTNLQIDAYLEPT